MPKQNKVPFPIPQDAKLYCQLCKTLRTVAEVLHTPDCDVAILDVCSHARSVHLPVVAGRLSVEHVGTVESAGLFPGDPRAKHELRGRTWSRW